MSNGTPEGIYEVIDLVPGIDASGPSDFVRVGKRIFFAAGHPEHGRELFALHVKELVSPELRRLQR